jgi:4'-phosphopantetheinyl transferase
MGGDFPDNQGFFGALKQAPGQARRRSGLRSPGDAVVWWMSTDNVSPARYRRWLRILDGDERRRAARFRFDHDRIDFVAAHALLRSMLALYLRRPAAQWRFVVGDFDKPRLAEEFGQPDIDFNLSHTRDLVAAAIVARGTIGIDVEKIDAAKADFAVAQKYFAAPEVEILHRTPALERTMCFFRLWTLKEAYLKATGAGLSPPLDSFAFTLEPTRIDFLRGNGDNPTRWHFETVPTTGRHVLSVAVAGKSGKRLRVVTRAIAPREL